jgi:hypothetical protein
MALYLKNISVCVLNMTTNTTMIKQKNCHWMGSSLIPCDRGIFLDLTNEKYIRRLSREDKESATVRIKHRKGMSSAQWRLLSFDSISSPRSSMGVQG